MASTTDEASSSTTGSNPSTPAPAVIRHAYVNHSITGEKQTAKCASCGSVISEKRGLPPALLGRFLELY
jgi:hypothetical protein